MKITTIVVAVLVLGAIGVTYYVTTNTAPERKNTHTLERAPKSLPSGTESYEVPVDAHIVTLTDVGFTPNELTIRKGDSVAFKTTGADLFWPASNLHPSHLIYAAFDPQEPIPPNLVWTFRFDTIGEWQYHDHLAPYFTGVITVTE